MLRDKSKFLRILRYAWKYGHQYDPRFSRLKNLNQNDLDKLDEGHPMAMDMIASVQHSGGSALQELVRIEHSRELAIDGDAGPATLALIDMPRCGVPDWGPGSGKHVTEDGLLVDEMGEVIEGPSLGSGSWRHSCFPEFQNVHVLVLSMNFSSAHSMWRSNLDEILRLVTDADHEVGLHKIYIDNSRTPNVAWTPGGWVLVPEVLSSSTVHRRVGHQRIGGSVIGWNTVARNHTCTTAANGAIDSGYGPSGERGIRVLCRLELHECTHGRGLGHYNATASVPSIMHPSITDGKVSWVGDRVETIQRRFFGGIRINPVNFPGWRFVKWA